MAKNEIAIVTESDIRGKIYIIRGQKVMLDADLAAIYGYTTGAFNQQVKRNQERFPEDLMFQLTPQDIPDSLKSQNVILNESGNKRGLHMKKIPYAFTEQGVYMLMTVLKGDLAVRQSLALIRLFKHMKDYLIDSQGVIGQQEILKLSVQTAENTREIHEIKQNMATKDDLTRFMKGFVDEHIGREFLFMDGQMVEADAAYSKIFGLAKKTIYLIDNYVGIKTLALLKNASPKVRIIVFTDNPQRTLHLTEYQDFCRQYPNMKISFQRTMDKFHDRYIVLDYKTRAEKTYVCGASSKDAGRRVTSVTKSTLKIAYHPMVDALLNNPPYILK